MPWLCSVCESRLSDPVFPVAAYAYAQCIYHNLSFLRSLDQRFNVLHEAWSIVPYQQLANALASAPVHIGLA